MLPMLPTLFDEALTNRIFDMPTVETHLPAFDCYETQTSWELVLDVPGVHKEDLKVTIERGELTIRGSRKAPEAPEGSARHRWAGEFVRTFRLGEGLDSEKVTASYKDGVLRLSIAKAEAAKPREIAIQS